MPELRNFEATATFLLCDAMSWDLYRTSLNEKLSDLAEEDILREHPEETKGMIAIESNVDLVGDVARWDSILFVVTITFEESEYSENK